LKKSEAMFSKTFYSSPIAMSIASENGQYIDVNHEFMRQTGFKRDEVIGHTSGELDVWLSTDDRSRYISLLYCNGHLTNFETRFKMHSGEIRDFLVSSELIEIDENKCSLNQIVDITERKRAEDSLAASEEKFRRMFETSIDLLYICQLDGRILDTSNSVRSILGYTVEEIKNVNAVELYAFPEDRSILMERVSTNGFVKNFETKFRRKNGQLLEVSVTCVGKKDNEGRVIGYQGVIRDITQFKKAEKALRFSEIKLRSFFEQSQDALTLVNSKGILVGWNRACKSITGYTEKEVVGESVWEIQYRLLPERERAGFSPEVFKNLFLKVLKTKDAPILNRLSEYPIRRSDGAQRTVQSIMFPIKMGKDFMIGNVLRDVTEKIKIEKELIQSREQLRNLSAYLQKELELQRKYISGLVHDELGQLLTSLKIDVDSLTNNLPANAADLIHKTGVMTDLIEESEKVLKKITMELRPVPVDNLGLIPVIESVLTQFQERNQIRCKFRYFPETFALKAGLSTELYHIIQECLTNIARHAKATIVTLELKQRAGKLTLEIRDNGRGIRPDEIVRPDSFGLIGMQERVHRYNGNMDIKGIPGKGTYIKITIPPQN
jgi:PAS domain S-box-containing protein